MSKAIRITHPGGPDVMQWLDVEVGEPAATEARVRHTAVGLNFIDVYHRSGLYPIAMPSGLGMEAAGVVEAVGSGISDLQPGDRVAYASLPVGAYAEVRLMPAQRLIKLPDTIDDNTAAAMMLKGMTAEYLLCRTYAVKAGDVVLLHAAAGGVGQIAAQWAHHLGATVIGTAGSEEKLELARQSGCHHVINYREEDFVARVREITEGRGVDVVYDSVGKATFEGSLDSLRPRGMMVSFGNASGAVPPFDPAILSAKGSLYFTRPTIVTYTASREDLYASAHALFDVVIGGAVHINIGQTYPLEQASQAHIDLQARGTQGSTLLLP